MAMVAPQLWGLQHADWSANEAVEVQLVARGLLELIDAFRFRDAGAPIPAPGIADAAEEIRAHALDAMHAAATHRILTDPDATDAAVDDDTDPGSAATAATLRASDAAAAARRVLRHLAQVGLGVAQHSYEDDDVELLERATVSVLTHDPGAVTAPEDRFPLQGTTQGELSVELAGLIARMLCEAPFGPGFSLVSDTGPAIGVWTTDDGGVRLRIARAGADAALAELGWIVDPIGDATRAFAGPVTITEVTSLMLRTLRDAFDVDLARLELRWTRDDGTEQLPGMAGW